MVVFCWLFSWKAAASGDMSFKEAPGPAEGQKILTRRGGMKKEVV